MFEANDAEGGKGVVTIVLDGVQLFNLFPILPMHGLGLDAIRNAIQERVKKSGLRRIARQVGMSASGLDKFIKGAQPYEKTRVKLEAWATRLQGGDERSAEDALLDELVSSLPEAGQEETKDALVQVLNRARRRWLVKR